MRTYGDLFREPEFTPLFATSSLQIAALTVSGLALGTLVYAETRSPLLSSLAMFGSSLAQVVGAATLLSAADRLPPRATTALIAACVGIGTAVLAVPGLPLVALFGVIAVMGLVSSVSGGVRWGLLAEVLPKEGYILGRSVFNMSSGVVQICGYAVGGVLVATLDPRGTLLVSVGLSLVAAVVAAVGLSARPPRAVGRPSIGQTWSTNARLLSDRSRLWVLLGLWVPNGLVVGCESLFVPYAPRHAGVLLAAAAFGMLIGDTMSGRFMPPRLRRRLAAPLRFLLAAPYLLFVVHPDIPLAAAIAVVASVGYCASLILMERLMELTPPDMHGQAQGLQSSGMMTWQAIGAAIAGAVAQRTSPADGLVIMAAASILVTLALSRGLRYAPPKAAEPQVLGAPRVAERASD